MSDEEQEWRETDDGDNLSEDESETSSDSDPEPTQDELRQLAIDWNLASPTDITTPGGFTDGGNDSDDGDISEQDIAALMLDFSLERKKTLESASAYTAVYDESGDGAMTHEGAANFKELGWTVGPKEGFSKPTHYRGERMGIQNGVTLNSLSVPSRSLLNRLYTINKSEVQRQMKPYGFQKGSTSYKPDDLCRSLYIEIGTDALTQVISKDMALKERIYWKPVKTIVSDPDTVERLQPLSWIDDMRDVAAQLYVAGGEEGFVVKTDV